MFKLVIKKSISRSLKYPSFSKNYFLPLLSLLLMASYNSSFAQTNPNPLENKVSNERLLEIKRLRLLDEEEIEVSTNPRDVKCSSSEEVIQAAAKKLINDFRSSARTCGSQRISSTGPLSLNSTLTDVAEDHSDNMAVYNFFDHRDHRGDKVANRATDAGYIWRSIGENIAGGYTNLADVFQGWVDSPSHCSNMIKDNYYDMGIACVESSSASSRYGTYWTLVLGRKLN